MWSVSDFLPWLKYDLTFCFFWFGTETESLWPELKLTHCTSLRSLCVALDENHYSSDTSSPTNLPLLSIVAAMAESGFTQTLQSFTVVQTSSDSKDNNPLYSFLPHGHSHQFECTLLSFHHLVHLVFLKGGYRTDFRPMAKLAVPIPLRHWERLAVKLPELHRRGILQNEIYLPKSCT